MPRPSLNTARYIDLDTYSHLTPDSINMLNNFSLLSPQVPGSMLGLRSMIHVCHSSTMSFVLCAM